MLLKEYGKAKAKLVRAFGLEPRHNTNGQSNGETRFLDLIASLPEAAGYDCVIDVGANRGDWTASAAERLQARGPRRFFCVEPIPTFANVIRDRFDNRARVEVIERVLSDRSGGTAEIFEAGGGGRMYRDYHGAGEGAAQTTKKIVSHHVPIATGDEVFGALGATPYLLKIDCDGHDLHVLRGFKQTLRDKRPLVQFEYSDFWIGAGSRLREACSLLAGAGYNTYKVFPDRLVRFRFNGVFETFGYQNIVAVPREVRALSGKVIPFPAA